MPTQIVQVPKYDFSLGLFVDEGPYWHGWSKWLGATGVTTLLPGDELAVAANALKAPRVGRIFTGISKASSEVVEAVMGQAKRLVPKALGKVRLPRSTARPTPVAEAIGGAPRSGLGRHTSLPMDLRGAGLVHGSSRFSRLEGFLSQRYGARVVFDDAVPFGKIDELAGATRLNPHTATFDVVAHELSHVRFSQAMGKWGTGKALTNFEVNLMESIGYWGTYRKGLASGLSHADALANASFGPSFAQSAIQALRSGSPAVPASLQRAIALYGRDYVEQALRFGGFGIRPGKSIPRM
ncbi:MAG: hypothetical protein J5I93_21930 [Pirellulaceae bacterium]|nr:hypothetical protein [Pirellulaceae bacterium]